MLTIKTNNVPRDVISAFELTARELKELDYLTDDNGDLTESATECSFVRYKGYIYDLSDFMRCPNDSAASPDMRDAGFCNWDGYASDSFFSGVLVRYVNDCEQVILATYYS